MTSAFWYCNCRHPGTKVYYADEIDKARELYDELNSMYAEMRSQRDAWKQLYADTRALLADVTTSAKEAK
jgi:hypothetical protein